MLFYQCKLGARIELAPTQATAKALDTTFKSVEIPTDKAGLMALINDLYAQIADAKAGRTPLPGGKELEYEEPTVVAVSNAYKPPAHHCPNCDRAPAAARLMANSHDATAVEDVINHIDDRDTLQRISTFADEARKLLDDRARKAAVVPAPRKRIAK